MGSLFAKSQMDTDLHRAIDAGNERLVATLSADKRNINKKGIDGDTPLVRAVKKHNIQFCKILLAADADSSITNNDKRSAVDLAKESGIEELKNLLSPRPLAEAAGGYMPSVVLAIRYQR